MDANLNATYEACNSFNNKLKEVVELSVSNSNLQQQQQLNLSTEESGYESDLTRKSSSSDKSSDTSVSSSPISLIRSSIKPEPQQEHQPSKEDLSEGSDLEQRDLSLDSIVTTNGAILEHQRRQRSAYTPPPLPRQLSVAPAKVLPGKLPPIMVDSAANAGSCNQLVPALQLSAATGYLSASSPPTSDTTCHQSPQLLQTSAVTDYKSASSLQLSAAMSSNLSAVKLWAIGGGDERAEPALPFTLLGLISANNDRKSEIDALRSDLDTLRKDHDSFVTSMERENATRKEEIKAVDS